jgi:ribosomal protein S18 acetylase RimI-like enzyme
MLHPLADKLEYHEESSNAHLAKNIGGEFIESDKALLIYSQPEFGPGLNFACRLRSDESHIDKLIDEICAWFAQRKIAPHIRVSPLTRPANLALLLERRGFVSTETETQMVLEGTDTAPATNPCVHVEIVGARDLANWVAIQHRAFGGFGNPGPMLIEMAEKSVETGMSVLYKARLDGEPVAAGVLTTWAGCKGIYGVATSEQARGQGVGTALMRQMIRDAQAAGNFPICLQAQTNSPTQRWYERMGFRVAYDRTGWTLSQFKHQE